MDLKRTSGNILGCLSVVASISLWAFALSTGQSELFGLLAEKLLVVSIILPPFAAWQASRWWLLMLLSPIAWYLVFKVFTNP